jgi:serine/threonine protein kinase
MIIGGELIGYGKQSCVVSDPNSESQVIKLYRGTMDEIENEISISKEVQKLDPSETRFVVPRKFRYFTLDELREEMPEVYEDFMQCNEENKYYEPLPHGVVVSYMTKVSKAPTRFSPNERAHLDDSVRLLNEKIMHNDIHPQNIMMHGKNPVLIDFGLATWGDGNERSSLQDTYQMMRETAEKEERTARAFLKRARPVSPVRTLEF